jgi:hypothetical protein
MKITVDHALKFSRSGRLYCSCCTTAVDTPQVALLCERCRRAILADGSRHVVEIVEPLYPGGPEFRMGARHD